MTTMNLPVSDQQCIMHFLFQQFAGRTPSCFMENRGVRNHFVARLVYINILKYFVIVLLQKIKGG